nr:cyclin-dependent kinase B2-1 [Tanacetum cinerariifolium]
FAGERIPYESSPATFPRRQVAGERYPQRQVAGESPRLSLGKAVNSLMYQRCKHVAFCRVHGVLHKDLTPNNLLLDRHTLILKIAGLGLARVFTLSIKKYTHEVGKSKETFSKVHFAELSLFLEVDVGQVCIFARGY